MACENWYSQCGCWFGGRHSVQPLPQIFHKISFRFREILIIKRIIHFDENRLNPLLGEAMQAILALEDGRIFRGHGYGYPGECQGEVVFNTSLTGYQEIATDPSYAGQIVVLTNPQIGNYGTNQADNESARPYIEGLIVREFSPISSNWRSEQVTDEYMERYSVPVLAEIDTRALVRHLRTHGVMRGVISTDAVDPEALVRKAKSIRKMDGTDLARVVSTKASYTFDASDSRNQGGDSLLPDTLFKDEEARKRMLHVVAY